MTNVKRGRAGYENKLVNGIFLNLLNISLAKCEAWFTGNHGVAFMII